VRLSSAAPAHHPTATSSRAPILSEIRLPLMTNELRSQLTAVVWWI
jgi:hypothetical protein